MMNPYSLLGIQPGASSEELRAAFRRRALELHPDQSGAGEDPFLELQAAYGVLSDRDRRLALDRRRHSTPEPLVRPAAATEPLRPLEKASGFREVPMFEGFGTFSPGLDELVERWMDNFCLGERPKSESMVSLMVDVPLSSEQAATGGELALSVPARVRCCSCGGGGEVGGYLCWRCGGTGALTGEAPVRVTYPAGMMDPYVVRLPLDGVGIRNFYLTVRFRVSGEEQL